MAALIAAIYILVGLATAKWFAGQRSFDDDDHAAYIFVFWPFVWVVNATNWVGQAVRFIIRE